MGAKKQEMLIRELGKQIDNEEAKVKLHETGIRELGRQIDYDQALAKLHEAGVTDEFLKAINEKPELMEAIKKIAPNVSARRAAADWSCCITVDKPITTSW